MNIVVLTAALSSLNSGLYSTGRILRSMSMGGSAPKFMSKMEPSPRPLRRDPGDAGVYVVGVFLNYLVPSQVFEIVLNVASLGIIASWGFIVVCQDASAQSDQGRESGKGQLQNAGGAVHLLADAAVPVQRAGADGLRLSGTVPIP